MTSLCPSWGKFPFFLIAPTGFFVCFRFGFDCIYFKWAEKTEIKRSKTNTAEKRGTGTGLMGGSASGWWLWLVALLCLSSLNRPFGSGIVTPSGLLLNSQILDFSWPNKTENFSPNPVSCVFFTLAHVSLYCLSSFSCSAQLPALYPTAQQHPAWQEAHVLPDAHGGEAGSGRVRHLPGRGVVQCRQSSQCHHSGALTGFHYISSRSIFFVWTHPLCFRFLRVLRVLRAATVIRLRVRSVWCPFLTIINFIKLWWWRQSTRSTPPFSCATVGASCCSSAVFRLHLSLLLRVDLSAMNVSLISLLKRDTSLSHPNYNNSIEVLRVQVCFLPLDRCCWMFCLCV